MAMPKKSEGISKSRFGYLGFKSCLQITFIFIFLHHTYLFNGFNCFFTAVLNLFGLDSYDRVN